MRTPSMKWLLTLSLCGLATSCSLLLGGEPTGTDAAIAIDLQPEPSDLPTIDASAMVDAPIAAPRHWQSEDTGQKSDLTSVWCADPNNVFVGGPSGVAYSTGDRKWQWQTLPRGTKSIAGNEAGDVYAFGDGLYHSVAGGNFSKVSASIGFGMMVLSPQLIYLVIGNGTILRGDGATWQTEFQNSSYFTRNIGGASGDLFVSTTNGIVLHSNGDGNWQPEVVPGATSLRAVWESATGDVYLTAYEGLFHSTGDGKWNNVVSARLNGIWGASADDIYAVGNNGLMLHYTRARNWQPEIPDFNVEGIDLAAVTGCSDGQIYAAGSYGTVLHLK